MDLSLTVIIAEISEIRNPDGKQRIYGRGVKIEATMGGGGGLRGVAPFYVIKLCDCWIMTIEELTS